MTLDNQDLAPAPDTGTTLDLENLTDEQKDQVMKYANEQLRGHSKKVEDENKALRKSVMGSLLADIGLSDSEGLGKAIAKEYSGEYTTEAIAEYAQTEYNHEAQSGRQTPATQLPDRATQLQAQSEPMTPEPQPTPGEQAQQRMHDPEASREDAQRSVASKVQEFNERFYGPAGPQAPPEGTS